MNNMRMIAIFLATSMPILSFGMADDYSIVLQEKAQPSGQEVSFFEENKEILAALAAIAACMGGAGVCGYLWWHDSFSDNGYEPVRKSDEKPVAQISEQSPDKSVPAKIVMNSDKDPLVPEKKEDQASAKKAVSQAPQKPIVYSSPANVTGMNFKKDHFVVAPEQYNALLNVLPEDDVEIRECGKYDGLSAVYENPLPLIIQPSGFSSPIQVVAQKIKIGGNKKYFLANDKGQVYISNSLPAVGKADMNALIWHKVQSSS